MFFKASSLTVLKSHMTNKHNESQKVTFDSGIYLSLPSPTPPSPCDLPPIECDSNIFNETCNICGKTFHTKQDLVNHNFDSHIHSINDKTCRLNDCSNIANNYFKSVKLSSKNKPPYEHHLICDACTQYVHIKKLENNPPVRF